MDNSTKTQEWDQFRADWPSNLANLMYEYGKLPGFSVTCNDTSNLNERWYTFNAGDEYGGGDLGLPVQLPESPMLHLKFEFDCAMGSIRAYYAAEAERDRRARLRRDALAKLTAEERKELGL